MIDAPNAIAALATEALVVSIEIGIES